MAHSSETYSRLNLNVVNIDDIRDLGIIQYGEPSVYLIRLPFGRTINDAGRAKLHFHALAQLCGRLHKQSTVCVLTTPADAATLLPYLEESLQFRHWIVLKTTADAYPHIEGQLSNRHAALLVLNRDKKRLGHTLTRINYTYCPACGKTTKDYGGKKHMHHRDGTLISDVWRDVEWNPDSGIDVVTDRLRDFFGLAPYNELVVCDLHTCKDLMPYTEQLYELGPTEATPATRVYPRRLRSRLIHGDCLEALRRLPANSVDFGFADLPYNLKKKYYKSSDDLETVEYFEWCDEWLAEFFRVLKPGHSLAVLNIPRWAARHYEFLSSIMNFQAWIAWDALGFPVRKIMPAHYGILCFSKGEARALPGLVAEERDDNESVYLTPQNGLFCIRPYCVSSRARLEINDKDTLTDLWHDVHRLKHNSQRVEHPCQLPPLLMRRLFALFTTPGEIILDGFDGAGTSTLVARQMGRRYIGIEKSKRYHNLAVKRHLLIEEGGDPFYKKNSVPQAKNSRVQRLPKKKYPVTKKVLQLEIKQLAEELGRLPTQDDVKAHSQHPFKYFKEYFINWGEVCAAARTTGIVDTPIGS